MIYVFLVTFDLHFLLFAKFCSFVYLILKKENKILLQRPVNDDYSIIDGHIASVETSTETLKREFEEELHAKLQVII